MHLLADVDWSTVAATICGAIVSMVAAVAGAGKFFLGYLSKREELAQQHATLMLERVETIADKFDDTVRQMQRDNLGNSREQMKTLLGIQRETVGAVTGLAKQVGELSHAITELRSEVGRKMDRPTMD